MNLHPLHPLLMVICATALATAAATGAAIVSKGVANLAHHNAQEATQ